MSSFTIDILFDEKHIELCGSNCTVYDFTKKTQVYSGSIEGLEVDYPGILVMLIEGGYIRPL